MESLRVFEVGEMETWMYSLSFLHHFMSVFQDVRAMLERTRWWGGGGQQIQKIFYTFDVAIFPTYSYTP